MHESRNVCSFPFRTQLSPHGTIQLCPGKIHAHIWNGHKWVWNTFLDDHSSYYQKRGIKTTLGRSKVPFLYQTSLHPSNEEVDFFDFSLVLSKKSGGTGTNNGARGTATNKSAKDTGTNDGGGGTGTIDSARDGTNQWSWNYRHQLMMLDMYWHQWQQWR